MLGTFLFIPPGTPHDIANVSDKPARVLMIVSPPGHEGYFVELAKLAANGAPDPTALTACATATIRISFRRSRRAPRPLYDGNEIVVHCADKAGPHCSGAQNGGNAGAKIHSGPVAAASAK